MSKSESKFLLFVEIHSSENFNKLKQENLQLLEIGQFEKREKKYYCLTNLEITEKFLTNSKTNYELDFLIETKVGNDGLEDETLET